MKDGNIIEQGNHQELMSQNGSMLISTIVNSQKNGMKSRYKAVKCKVKIGVGQKLYDCGRRPIAQRRLEFSAYQARESSISYSVGSSASIVSFSPSIWTCSMCNGNNGALLTRSLTPQVDNIDPPSSSAIRQDTKGVTYKVKKNEMGQKSVIR